MPKEVEAVHLGHSQIEHQTVGGFALNGSQKIFRGCERLDSEADRRQQISERPTQSRVDVHDRDRLRLVLTHAFLPVHQRGLKSICGQASPPGGTRLPYLGGVGPVLAGVIPRRAAVRAAPTGRGSDEVPAGDQPGFVRTPDDHTLLIPDRPGNNRIGTMRNILSNPVVGMIFFVPGFLFLLRKALMRSRLWDPRTYLDRSTSHGRILAEQTKTVSVEDAEASTSLHFASCGQELFPLRPRALSSRNEEGVHRGATRLSSDAGRRAGVDAEPAGRLCVFLRQSPGLRTVPTERASKQVNGPAVDGPLRSVGHGRDESLGTGDHGGSTMNDRVCNTSMVLSVGLAVAVMLTGCATIRRSEARSTEQLLAAAGVVMRPADPARPQPRLAALQPHPLSAR